LGDQLRNGLSGHLPFPPEITFCTEEYDIYARLACPKVSCWISFDVGIGNNWKQINTFMLAALAVVFRKVHEVRPLPSPAVPFVWLAVWNPLD
jgi:hypothetical protein